MGISESNMVATAAGLSTTGKIPFVNTFTVFLTTLGLISTRAQVCYGNLNVKFGGAYCGMSDAFDACEKMNDGPSVIIAKTVKGKGVSFMEGKAAWHGKPVSDEDLAKAIAELGGEN